MMIYGENMLPIGNRVVRGMICKVCGKEGDRTNIMTHIEAKHITTVPHSCSICGKSSRTKDAMRKHKSNHHKM